MRKTAIAWLAALVFVAAITLAVTSGSDAARQASPACSSTYLATWSPDGTQIAFVGRRLHHGPLPLRGICVANAAGKQAAPLPHTVCSRQCSNDLMQSPTQLFWVQPDLLLYGDDYRIFAIPVGGKPQQLGKGVGKGLGSFEQFSVDTAGDRLAAGFSECPQCAGPVTVLDLPSGNLVSRIGGTKLDNVEASISPDGQQVAFVRNFGDGGTKGIWTAAADGSHLKRLVRKGFMPLWSPDGKQITYTLGASLRLVPAQGGKSRTLIRRGIQALYGWSPNGRWIAVARGNRLELVNAATGKVRKLLKLHFFAALDSWSANSQQMLVTQPVERGCTRLWRVPVGHGKAQLLRHC